MHYSFDSCYNVAMIKTLIFDIDGTLTNSKKIITPLTKLAILKAQEKGIRVCLASGRATHGLYKFVAELELDKHDGVLISYNGARVSSADGKYEYFKDYLNKDRTKGLLKHLSKFDKLTYILEEDDHLICEDCFNNIINYQDKPFNVLKYEARMNHFFD